MSTMYLPFTRHAEIRANQRGARNKAIAVVEQFADRDLNTGNGCSREFLSRQMADELKNIGLNPQLAEDAARLQLIRSSRDLIVTIMKGNKASGRQRPSFRYRRARGSRRHVRGLTRRNFPFS